MIALPKVFRRAGLTAGAVLLLAGCASEGLPKPPEYAAWSRGRTATDGGAPSAVLIPRRRSAEYLRSWGARMVNPEPAFRAGLTGRGVTVAVIDTGLSLAQPEVARAASPDSIDLIATRGLEGPDANHGGEVVGGLAAALDGGGLVGVAYGARVLSIRADLDGSCARKCTFRTSDLARGMDYATAHGAKIIVLAVQGEHRLSPVFEAALERAAKAGAVVVIAAGNETEANPKWPARYAADPRFVRAVIAVGAARTPQELASWSNRAGVTGARYIAAPGDRLPANCDDKVCYLVSGSSFSTAYVAGALALILEARPELSPQDAAQLLLASARRERQDVAVVGQGFLDIGRAYMRARGVSGASPG